jgi:hypothetical protein
MKYVVGKAIFFGQQVEYTAAFSRTITPQGTELFLPGDKQGHFQVTLQLKSRSIPTFYTK